LKPKLGIVLGEATGIGPEIVAKLCAADRLTPHCRPLLIGDARVLALGQRIAGVSFPFKMIREASEAAWDGPIPLLDLANIDPAGLRLGEVNPASGKVTGETLIVAMGLLVSDAIDGLVFAPLNKEALQRGGHAFPSEDHLFAHYLGWTGYFTEVNVLENLWTSRVTSHIPLAKVAPSLSVEKVLQAVRLIDETLRRARVETPRIALAALNPHGGEGGLCGREEVEIIRPAVLQAREEGINALGPFPADTLFINAFRGDYDAVVTMYHDQGQIALKLKGFQFAVTVQGGLPYPIVTPAHGTAFDIVGRGIARTDATEQAVILCSRMAAKGTA
jgi:4-hydroxy-L-threonine phosphate dehydrogenase PdxA